MSHTLLHKQASGFTAVNEWLSKNPDTAKSVLDGIFNTRTASSLLGAAAGTAIGAMLPAEEKKKRLRNAALGLLAGGGAGYGAARLAPETSRAVVKAITNNMIMRPAGRMLTQVISPRHYENKLEQLSLGLRYHKGDMFKALFRSDDTPSHAAKATGAFDVAREQPFRALFGLRPRAGAVHYPKNEDGTFRLPADQENQLLVDKLDDMARARNGSPITVYDEMLGNFQPKLTADAKAVDYQDRWDVDLWKNEKVNSLPNALRHLFAKFSDPVTFKGRIPLTPQQIADLPNPDPGLP